MSGLPKPPPPPRFTFPPPAYGTPEWEDRMQKKVAYIEAFCAFYRAQPKPPKPRPWWLLPSTPGS